MTVKAKQRVLPILINGDDQSDEVTLLSLCDVKAEEFVALGGPANDDESDGDSEWEDIEKENDN